jgi:MFS family permease
MINFTACGVLFAFGVYQALYEDLITTPNSPFTGSSSAEIGLIGGLAVGLMKIGAPLTVAWTDKFGPRPVIFVGGLLFGLGSILASFGTSLWHIILSQGLLMGIGSCLSFMPSITVTPTWFNTHRGLAMGIVSAGTGIGGLVWAPVTTACISALGYSNSLRLSGATASALICIAALFLSQPPDVKSQPGWSSSRDTLGLLKIPLPSWRLAKQRRFISQLVGGALQNAAYYIPVIYLAVYGATLGYSPSEGANLIAISNACNAIGKIAVGYTADRTGRLNALLLTTFVSAITPLCFWIPSAVLSATSLRTSRALLITNTITYGLFASAYQSLFPATQNELFSREELLRVNGVIYMAQGLAGLAGTPVAGLLVVGNKDSSDYINMAILVMALLLGATSASAVAHYELRKTYRADGVRGWKI